MLEKILASGGVTAALAASTCCVVPLSLAAVGVSGAWLASLSALTPFQTWLRVLAILLLGAGFWMVYWRSARSTDSKTCVVPTSQRTTKSALWIGALLMALVLTSGWWARLVA